MIPTLPRRTLLAMTLALACLVAPTRAVAKDVVTVFAAASLKSALDEIVAQYPAGDSTVQVSYGGSSTLARQIQIGAPANLFISANPDWMDVLVQDGLIDRASHIELLSNRLVLIARTDLATDLTIAPDFDLADELGDGRLAMALVDAVPAGLYGRAALQFLGVWDAVHPKVAQVDNVRAALMLVAMGEAPFGIVYATDAAAEPKVQVIGTFPADTHPPILYPAAVIAGPDAAGARALLDYLDGPEAGAVFRKHGFGLQGDGA